MAKKNSQASVSSPSPQSPAVQKATPPQAANPPARVGDIVLYVATGVYGGVEHRAAIVAAMNGDRASLHVFPAADNAIRMSDVVRDESAKTVGTWHARP